jgi:hypothetical protein
MSDTADEQAPRRQLESWAADRVRAWGEVQKDDYDFRSWAKGASKNCLSAGAVYEYARESRKLRCLLVLMNPRRQREPWEIVRPGSIDGRRLEPGEIESYPAEALWLPCSFDGLDEHEAERALGGFLYCLRDLADYLADNLSFGELFRIKQQELEGAFGGLNELARVKREFRYFLPVPDAVEIATLSELEHITVEETISDEEKRMIQGGSCSETIATTIRWRFTDSEIVAALKKFVREHRPRNSQYEAQQPKKGSRRDSVQSALDCLSAMRLASYLPRTIPPATPRMLATWQAGASAELRQSAIEAFDEVRLGGRGKHIAESNFDNLIIEARKAFKKSFPFGEDARMRRLREVL